MHFVFHSGNVQPYWSPAHLFLLWSIQNCLGTQRSQGTAALSSLSLPKENKKGQRDWTGYCWLLYLFIYLFIMKIRDIYWRRCKIQETLYIGQWRLSPLQNRHLGTSHSSPNCHQLPHHIFLNLIDNLKSLPFLFFLLFFLLLFKYSCLHSSPPTAAPPHPQPSPLPILDPTLLWL